MSTNRLMFLPRDIGYLVRLEVLDVSFCRLAYLPHTLCSCEALSCLQLAHNRLDPLLVVSETDRGLYCTIDRERSCFVCAACTILALKYCSNCSVVPMIVFCRSSRGFSNLVESICKMTPNKLQESVLLHFPVLIGT